MKQNRQSDSHEREVLRVYQKVNPSAVLDIEKPAVWRKYSERMERRFVTDYALPTRVFKGASVLDVGCGTGEKCLVFASWGATVTGVDYNEKALERAHTLASKSRFSERLVFYRGTLTELPEPVRDQHFDFVHVDGVLHHTADPEAALNVVAARVAVGGFLVVRNYQAITSFQRLVKRMIVRLGVGEDATGIMANTKRLFYEDVERSIAGAGRTEDQAMYDNFVNPHYQPFGHKTPFSLCDRFGFRIHAFVPGVDVSPLAGPGGVMPQDGDSGLLLAWWGTTLARAAVATDPAALFLEKHRALLEDCSAAGVALEDSLNELTDKATADAWDMVVESMVRYLSHFRSALGSLYKETDRECAAFLEELRALQPLIRDSIEEGRAPEALPETVALFRKMSGFPMASFVLERPEPEPEVPFTLPGEK